MPMKAVPLRRPVLHPQHKVPGAVHHRLHNLRVAGTLLWTELTQSALHTIHVTIYLR